MLTIFIRTIIMFAVGIVAMRIMGKRQIGEMQPSELVVTIMISELASIPMQNAGIPLVSGVLPIITLVMLEVVLSFVMMKNKGVRKMVLGVPSVIVQNGKVNKREMERLRMTSADLAEELRLQKCTDVRNVEYAIVETNGKLSIILKSDKQKKPCYLEV